MRSWVALALLCALATGPSAGAVAAGSWWLGISVGGTQLVGTFVEYRLGEIGVVASLGTAVPWRLNDLSLAFQLRRYFGGAPPVPYLGLGGWAFLVQEGGEWGWLTSLDLTGGLQWGLGEKAGLELGAMLHYFLSAYWQGEARFNFRFLILPFLALKWAP